MDMLDIAVYLMIVALAMAVVLLLLAIADRPAPCPHKNRGIVVDETICEVEVTTVVCKDCGKRFKTTMEA